MWLLATETPWPRRSVRQSWHGFLPRLRQSSSGPFQQSAWTICQSFHCVAFRPPAASSGARHTETRAASGDARSPACCRKLTSTHWSSRCFPARAGSWSSQVVPSTFSADRVHRSFPASRGSACVSYRQWWPRGWRSHPPKTSSRQPIPFLWRSSTLAGQRLSRASPRARSSNLPALRWALASVFRPWALRPSRLRGLLGLHWAVPQLLSAAWEIWPWRRLPRQLSSWPEPVPLLACQVGADNLQLETSFRQLALSSRSVQSRSFSWHAQLLAVGCLCEASPRVRWWLTRAWPSASASAWPSLPLRPRWRWRHSTSPPSSSSPWRPSGWSLRMRPSLLQISWCGLQLGPFRFGASVGRPPLPQAVPPDPGCWSAASFAPRSSSRSSPPPLQFLPPCRARFPPALASSLPIWKKSFIFSIFLVQKTRSCTAKEQYHFTVAL